MKIEHAVMRLKWMIFGVALLLGCVLFNQVTLLELRAAQEYGDSVCVPRLEETQGRYTIADGTTV